MLTTPSPRIATSPRRTLGNLVAFLVVWGDVPGKSTAPYLFGDLLALARQSWVRQMAGRLNQLGYLDYRRGDAAALRFLRRGQMPIGRLGSMLGMTRQAARKVVNGLEQRDYVRTERDAHDFRRHNVLLTPRGEVYAQAVVGVIDALNRDLCARVDLVQLTAAAAVMRAAISGDNALERVAVSVRPPG